MEKSLCPMCEEGEVVTKTFKELYKIEESNHIKIRFKCLWI